MENEFNPYTHTSQDDMAHMDLDYWLEQVKATVATVAHLAVPVTGEVNPPQLYVEKRGVSRSYPGAYVSYSLVVENQAQVPGGPALGIVVSDDLPTLTVFISTTHSITTFNDNRIVSHTIPYLGAGQKETVTITVQISDSITRETTITNTVYATVEGLPVVMDSLTTTIVPRAKTYLPVIIRAEAE